MDERRGRRSGHRARVGREGGLVVVSIVARLGHKGGSHVRTGCGREEAEEKRTHHRAVDEMKDAWNERRHDEMPQRRVAIPTVRATRRPVFDRDAWSRGTDQRLSAYTRKEERQKARPFVTRSPCSFADFRLCLTPGRHRFVSSRRGVHRSYPLLISV
jgi:hypothetical protein